MLPNIQRFTSWENGEDTGVETGNGGNRLDEIVIT